MQVRGNLSKTSENLECFSDKNGLPLDLDIEGDLADLKKNLAKYKKGKHGKELDDIDIEELDFVSRYFTTFQLGPTHTDGILSHRRDTITQT